MSFSTVMRDDRICVTQQSLNVLDHSTTLLRGLLSCGDTVIYYALAGCCFISVRLIIIHTFVCSWGDSDRSPAYTLDTLQLLFTRQFTPSVVSFKAPAM